ncbi:MAG: putative transcriptional regulator [Anaerocolumna sp.]|jgi:transcriptional regulator with XRE-family HTH domain|nr:putative transcriptional regulator [Herbinix sp.]MDF2952111.1 putative transcriptional regulator [Anaerocolumna sp.]
MTIGDRIKQLREEKKITQEELAKHIDSTKQTIHKYENNIVTNIPSDKIEMIAYALESTPAYLMGWTDKRNDDVKTPSLYKALDKLDIKDNELTEDEISSIINFVNFMRNNKK